MVKKEISSVKNWTEAFLAIALCSANSPHRVSAFPSRILMLRLFLWNLQSDIWKPIEVYVEKKYSKIKSEKNHSEKPLCVLLVHLTELQLSLQEAVH